MTIGKLNVSPTSFLLRRRNGVGRQRGIPHCQFTELAKRQGPAGGDVPPLETPFVSAASSNSAIQLCVPLAWSTPGDALDDGRKTQEKTTATNTRRPVRVRRELRRAGSSRPTMCALFLLRPPGRRHLRTAPPTLRLLLQAPAVVAGGYSASGTLLFLP